jgi:hypothetical protein
MPALEAPFSHLTDSRSPSAFTSLHGSTSLRRETEAVRLYVTARLYVTVP